MTGFFFSIPVRFLSLCGLFPVERRYRSKYRGLSISFPQCYSHPSNGALFAPHQHDVDGGWWFSWEIGVEIRKRYRGHGVISIDFFCLGQH